MRILILNWKDIKNPDVGGAEILLYEIAKRFVKKGDAVSWFCRKFAHCRQRERLEGIEIIRKGNKLTVYLEAWKYYKQMHPKPDKVIESINTICWQTPLYVPKEKRVALVNQLAKEVLFYELPFGISHAAFLLEGLEYQTYKDTKILCYSKSVKQDIAKFNIPGENIFIFSLGINHDRYNPGKKSEKPLFVFVARLAKMKRANLCVLAMVNVVKKYPEAQLAIVGYGPEEENLKTMINRYNLSKNVYIVNKDNLFFEKHERDAKVKLMQSAWALILPSVKEGWGMVVTEAAACGTPSIVTDVTGLKDSVIDGKTGFIVSENPRPTELSDAMLKIITDDKLRKKLSNNALSWAANFSWEKSYLEFRKLIK